MQQQRSNLGYAQRMRFAPTDAEAALWHNLRAGRLADHKFKRQQPIGNYIVDFVCFQRKLVVEVDGGQHVEAKPHDDLRTAWLETQGFRMIRFWNDDVLLRMERVLDEIIRVLKQ
jgi:adenine-specific DNA-methyltransferase